MSEALSLYSDFGALWDIRRAEATLRRHGIRRGVRGSTKRATQGWEALTQRSRVEIAREAFNHDPGAVTTDL